MRHVILALIALSGCETEEIGMGSGSITVINDDSAEVRLLITDNAQCVVGLHSSVNSGTRRLFDIGEKSFVCVEENPPGVPVENGKTYHIDGGKLRAE